ncbi:MAG: rhodanese-like domain-containing protein [Phycisphaeraceae bacterium]
MPALFALVLSACDSAPKTSDEDLRHLSYKGLREIMADAGGKSPLMLIDIRPPADFEKGHIPGATNIPDPQQFMHIGATDPRLTNASHVVVYGEDFRRNFADPAAKKLIGLGYDNIYSFPGGWGEWQKNVALEQPTPEK